MKKTFVCNAALLSQLVVSGALLIAGPAFAQDPPKQTPQTASDVKTDKSDRELTRQIRKAIVADKSLSTQAHNVKILAKDGAVTLKGQVKTDDEKKTVEEKASGIAGTGRVSSELTVGPNTSKSRS